MINNIIQAIASDITESFGPGYQVLSEPSEPMVKPCFFIATLANSKKQTIGNRYYLQHNFDVQFHPATINNAEMLTTAEKLYEVLEYIEDNEDLLRGTNMSYQIEGAMLHFFVSYNLYAYRTLPEGVPPEEDMDTFEINTEVKQ